MSDSGCPGRIGEGKIRPDPSRSFAASFKTANAASDSGTRCSMPPFMRPAGTVHSALSRSTSSQWAPLASPLLAAVNTPNQRQNLAASDAWDAFTTSRAWGNFLVRQHSQMGFQFRHRRQHPVYGLPSGIAFDEAVGHGPPHYGADSLPDSPGGLRNGGLRPAAPNGSEDLKHICSAYPVNRHIPQNGEGMSFQGLQPG